MKLLWGDRAAQIVSGRIGEKVASITVLKQTPANRRVEGQLFTCTDYGTLWVWRDSATCPGDDVLAVRPNDLPSSGRFMRMTGAALLRVPFYATTPTGTNVLVIPSGSIIQAVDFGVNVSAIFSGGASGCVLGLSSANLRGHTGAYSFIGSCGATALNQNYVASFSGTGMGYFPAPVSALAPSVMSNTADYASRARPWLKGGDTLRQDVGTAFATGIGEWLVSANILHNPGF